MQNTLQIIKSLTDFHVAESNSYATDKMYTKADAHKQAVMVFIRRGSEQYMDHCLSMRLAYYPKAKDSDYKP